MIKYLYKLRLPASIFLLIGFPSFASAEILFHLKSLKQISIACTGNFEITNNTDDNITTLITKVFLLDNDKDIIDSMMFTGRLKRGKTSLSQLDTPGDCADVKFIKMGGVTMVEIDGNIDWMIKPKIEDLMELRSSITGIEAIE